MNARRWLPLLILPLAVAAFYALGLQHLLTLDNAKAQQAAMIAFRDAHPWLTLGLFPLAFAAMGVLPIPLVALLAVIGGALYGLPEGFVLVSVGSAVGACSGFITARYLLRGEIQKRYGARLGRIQQGIERDGWLYLFSLRLVPVLPFFVTNLLFGLSPMRLRTFFFAGFVAMAPGALILTNAGRELSKIESLDDLFSPTILLSLLAVAALPWMLKLATRWLRRERAS